MRFEPVSSLHPGDLYRMLSASYREFVAEQSAAERQCLLDGWQTFDREAFANPETIGKCIVIGVAGEQVVGFASWDPRNFPQYGIIGQNCVLPDHRGMGYGSRQIEYVLDLFKARGCRKAVVSTGDLPFFTPAQKMYRRLGFTETARTRHEQYAHGVILYELTL